jgi:hypothetical protein
MGAVSVLRLKPKGFQALSAGNGHECQ